MTMLSGHASTDRDCTSQGSWECAPSHSPAAVPSRGPAAAQFAAHMTRTLEQQQQQRGDATPPIGRTHTHSHTLAEHSPSPAPPHSSVPESLAQLQPSQRRALQLQLERQQMVLRQQREQQDQWCAAAQAAVRRHQQAQHGIASPGASPQPRSGTDARHTSQAALPFLRKRPRQDFDEGSSEERCGHLSMASGSFAPAGTGITRAPAPTPDTPWGSAELGRRIARLQLGVAMLAQQQCAAQAALQAQQEAAEAEAAQLAQRQREQAAAHEAAKAAHVAAAAAQAASHTRHEQAVRPAAVVQRGRVGGPKHCGKPCTRSHAALASHPSCPAVLPGAPAVQGWPGPATDLPALPAWELPTWELLGTEAGDEVCLQAAASVEEEGEGMVALLEPMTLEPVASRGLLTVSPSTEDLLDSFWTAPDEVGTLTDTVRSASAQPLGSFCTAPAQPLSSFFTAPAQPLGSFFTAAAPCTGGNAGIGTTWTGVPHVTTDSHSNRSSFDSVRLPSSFQGDAPLQAPPAAPTAELAGLAPSASLPSLLLLDTFEQEWGAALDF